MDRYPRRDDLREMQGYHSPQVAARVRLNTNESPIEPPSEFVASLADAVADVRWNRYPDRSARELRTAIGAMHGVGPENVFVANGSNEVLQAVLLAYSGAGRVVATFEPTYQLHSHIARVAGATVVNGSRNGDFTLDPSEVRRVCDSFSPSVTFLCSPNNPTGMAESPEVVSVAVERTPGIVIVDEAYAQFSPFSAVSLVADSGRLAVSRTFSKTWSMAALRLGYVVAPNWMVADLEIVALPYHLDALKQRAGLLALRHVARMESGVRAVVAERERLIDAMRRLPLTVWSSQANFILFRPNDRRGSDVWQGLLESGVLVRDCSSWEGLADCLRVTVGTPEENDVFLGALRGVLAARD